MRKPGLVDQLSEFSEALRNRGLTVTSEQTADMARALTIVDLARRSQAQAALRSLTVTNPSQIPVFNEEFQIFFDRALPRLTTRKPNAPPTQATASYHLETAGIGGDTDVVDQGGASAAERLATRDFSDLDDEELGEARRLVMSMMWHPSPYQTRRWVVGDGRRPDLRRTLHRAVGPTGDLMEMQWKRRRKRERPLIIIADVSGSMDKYAELFLVFAHAAQRRLREVEVFTFSTELTRITEDLARRDTRSALARVSGRVHDWSGGTKIGEALGTWNRIWSRRLARGGPVVLILSDGWDCGDPTLLSSEMSRLARSVHQVVWLNPLAARDGYQPLTRGMQAVMPHIDELLPAASVNDFRGVVRVLESMTGTPRP
ncbi:MAG TPA: VWA domain-containing protein [Acidimicrobiia bacterium]